MGRFVGLVRGVGVDVGIGIADVSGVVKGGSCTRLPDDDEVG